MQILEAEIVYSQLPLKEAFKMIATQIPKPTKTFFAALSQELDRPAVHFPALWDEGVRQFQNESCLSENEREILLQFGQTLGQHDFEQQQKHIHLAITHLERELEEARDHQYKYAKLAKSLGVLSGLFIVLLLI